MAPRLKNTYMLHPEDSSVTYMPLKHPVSGEVITIVLDTEDVEKMKSEYWRLLKTNRVVNSYNTTSLQHFIFGVSRDTHFLEFMENRYIDHRKDNIICVKRNTYIDDPKNNQVILEIRSNLEDIVDPKLVLLDPEDVADISVFIWHVYDGYACTNPGSTKERDKWRMQRLIMQNKLKESSCFDLVVDHIDFNRLNNRKSNLQIITPEENNSRKNPNLTVEHNMTRKGVFRNIDFYGSVRWVSSFINPKTSRNCVKYFSVKKHGEEKAIQLAKTYLKENS